MYIRMWARLARSPSIPLVGEAPLGSHKYKIHETRKRASKWERNCGQVEAWVQAPFATVIFVSFKSPTSNNDLY